MNLDKKALAGFIKEVEDSRDRQKGETDLQREVFKRARAAHFDVKALRIVLQRRAMETSARDSQDYNVHAYELALGAKKQAIEAMEQGASAREAAKAHNLPRASVTALKAGTENENIEPILETARETPGDGTGTAETSSQAPAVAIESCVGVEGHASSTERPEGGQVDTAPPAAGIKPGPQEPTKSLYQRITGAFHDPLEIPAHLDRRPKAQA